MGWDARVRDAVALGPAAVRAVVQARPSVPWQPAVLARLGRDVLAHGIGPGIGGAPGADRHPDAVAVIDATGLTLTHRELERLTRGAAATLAGSGLAPGATAAVLGRNSAGFAVAIAAVPRTGADLVYLNPGFTPAQLAGLIADRGVSLVLADPELADRLPAGVSILPLDDPMAWSAPGPFRASRAGGRHIILTSGTTGRPKGADRSGTPLPAVVSLLAGLPYRERDVHVLAAPLFHSWGWLNHRVNALLDSCEVMVPRASAQAVLDAAADHGAGLIITTPVVVARLAQAGPGDRDLSRLRGILVSGAPIPADVIEALRAGFGDVLYNLYGSTEVGYASVATPRDLALAPTTAGRPLPGVRVAILDEHGRELPPGQAGEVWVASAGTFGGYVDGRDKDRRGDLVATGDVGHLDARRLLFIHGRGDDLVISGGENVHPSEVEAVLRDHPDVGDAAAVGRPDPQFGQRIVAFVVPRDGVPADGLAERVQAFAAQRLAPYQRPREVTVMAELPRNETGKLLRRLL